MNETTCAELIAALCLTLNIFEIYVKKRLTRLNPWMKHLCKFMYLKNQVSSNACLLRLEILWLRLVLNLGRMLVISLYWPTKSYYWHLSQWGIWISDVPCSFGSFFFNCQMFVKHLKRQSLLILLLPLSSSSQPPDESYISCSFGSKLNIYQGYPNPQQKKIKN